MQSPQPTRNRSGGPKPRQAVVALLCGALGFGLVASVHTHRTPAALQTARPEDLVRILDGLTAQSDRLRTQLDHLQAERNALSNTGDQAAAALSETTREAATLGVLAGTVAARGPGVVITVADPRGQVLADNLLDAVEELRDAGAEALEIGGRPTGGGGVPAVVRIVASTAFLDAGAGQVAVGGTTLAAPYTLTVIGDPATLAAALRIPGGVVDTIARLGGTVTTQQEKDVTVAALRTLEDPRYARPAPESSAGAGS